MRCIHYLNQFVVDDEWEDNPYNIAQGGPCTAPLSFFTDSTVFISKSDVSNSCLVLTGCANNEFFHLIKSFTRNLK
jgi:hypothetical protein